MPKITIYGASSHCWAVSLQIAFSPAPAPICDIVAFVDDVEGGKGLELESRPVVSFDAWRRDYVHLPCFCLVGKPQVRQALISNVVAAGGSSVSLYDQPGTLPPRVSAGRGSLVLGPGGIGPNTRIGEHTQILPMHTIGHDVTIGSFVTIAPSCAVSGYVVIEDAAFIGVNATILNGRADRPLVIGAGAVIAAGAVVTKSVPAGATWMGNPARPIRDLPYRRRGS